MAFRCCAMPVCFFFLISVFTLSCYSLWRLPDLPTFKVSSTSAAVKNISGHHLMAADLKVGLLVQQVNDWGVMSYDNITASTFLNNNQQLFHVALLPFEQRGFNRRVVNVSSDNMAMNVTNHSKSGVSFLNIELRATITFNSETWTWFKLRKSPIRVVCKDVKVQFSSNTTTNLQFHTKPGCGVDGLWRKKSHLLRIRMDTVFILVFLMLVCLIILIIT